MDLNYASGGDFGGVLKWLRACPFEGMLKSSETKTAWFREQPATRRDLDDEAPSTGWGLLANKPRPLATPTHALWYVYTISRMWQL